MIATKPSDLVWREGPLPEPNPDLALLVWVSGELANHIGKAFAPEGRWMLYYWVPVEDIGRVAFWAILRDEPYTPGLYVPLAETDPEGCGGGGWEGTDVDAAGL